MQLTKIYFIFLQIFPFHFPFMILIRAIVFLLFVVIFPAFGQRPPIPAGQIVGSETCRDCHEEMVEQWEKTAHATSLEKMLSSDRAAEIAAALDMEPAGIPMKASCVRCHFTQEDLAGTAQTTMAVSCESCHGGAVGWIEEHNRKNVSRQSRVDSSLALGMGHPESILAVSKSCFECHIVDDEQLVNHAGHPALSEGFEILSWYSGEVKHNFLVGGSGSSVKTHVSDPRPIPPERKRMLYLNGKLLHLAYLLQSLARATDAPVDRNGKFIRLGNGEFTYAVQLARAIKRVECDLEDALHFVAVPEYDEALALIRSIRLETGKETELREASATVFRLSELFCEKRNGTQFAAIDSLLAKLEVKAVD